MIRVPVGCVVSVVFEEEKQLLGELLKEGQDLCVSRGGTGGRGNTHFATSTNKRPMLAEGGNSGETVELLLELLLETDAAIIGKPNAGKSQLLKQISKAEPEVAAYPFTTQQPILGVVEQGWKAYKVAELPGIIHGSHYGKGLGNSFLRHLQRARLLLHIVDGSAEDPLAALHEVNAEIEAYDPTLMDRPQVVIVNKVDLPGVQEQLPAIRRRLRKCGVARHYISATTGKGTTELAAHIGKLLDQVPSVAEAAKPIETILKLEPRFDRPSVSRDGEVFVVSSPRAERLVRMPDLRQFQTRIQLRKALVGLGVVRALEDAGVQPGDRVRIGAREIQWE